MLGAGVAHSVWCLATDWTTGRSRFDPWQRQKDFSSRLCPQTSSGPTKPPVQWVPGVLSPGIMCGHGVTLTTHPHPVPSYTSSPKPLWRVVGLLYFLCFNAFLFYHAQIVLL
jgi:hypothetical protein